MSGSSGSGLVSGSGKPGSSILSGPLGSLSGAVGSGPKGSLSGALSGLLGSLSDPHGSGLSGSGLTGSGSGLNLIPVPTDNLCCGIGLPSLLRLSIVTPTAPAGDCSTCWIGRGTTLTYVGRLNTSYGSGLDVWQGTLSSSTCGTMVFNFICLPAAGFAVLDIGGCPSPVNASLIDPILSCTPFLWQHDEPNSGFFVNCCTGTMKFIVTQ